MKNQPRNRSCFTIIGKPKMRFDTRAEAKKWERMMREKYPDNKPLAQYRCEHCGYFHNGEYPSDPNARAGKRNRRRSSSSGSFGGT